MAAPLDVGLGRRRIATFYASETWLVTSPALASVASLLARWSQRVLLVDWDIGGPGIERFFPGLVDDGARLGIVDLAEARQDGAELDWRRCVVEAPASVDGQVVRIITAGRHDGRHVQRLRRIDWRALFVEADFAAYLERLRAEWLREHDFVLVNCPAGPSDATTICTVYLPDLLVALYSPGPESIEEVADIARRVRRARSTLPFDRGHLAVLPVPARDERSGGFGGDGGGLREIIDRLHGLYRDVLPREVELEDALEVLRIPVHPDLGGPAQEEGEGNPDLQNVLDSYSVLARLVGSGLRWEAPPPPDGGGAPPSSRAHFFISYSDADRQWASWVAWILRQAGYRVLMWAWDFVPGPYAVMRMAWGVRDAAQTIALLSPAYLRSVYGRADWQAALASDPRWLEQKLLPVRIAPYDGAGRLAGATPVDLVGLDDETTAAQRLLAAASEALGERDARSRPSAVPRAEGSERPPFPRRLDSAGYEPGAPGALAARASGGTVRHRAEAGIMAWVAARAGATARQLARLSPAGVAAFLAAAALTALSEPDGSHGAADSLGPAVARLAGIMAEVAAHLHEDRTAPVTREDLRDALAADLLDRLGGTGAGQTGEDVVTFLRTVGAVHAALRAAFDVGGHALQEHLALAFGELGTTSLAFVGLREDALAALDSLQQEYTEAVFRGRNRTERNRPPLHEVTLLRRRLLSPVAPNAAAGEGSSAMPYRGLAAFQAEDARWFHGRAASVAALVNRLAERLAGPAVVMAVGPSGAGKSSLLNAGFLPGIGAGMLGVPGAETWPHLVMHPGPEPVLALSEHLGDVVRVSPEGVARQIRSDPNALVATAWQAAGGPDARLLIVVDQFEELFTRCGDPIERDHFIRALRTLATPDRSGTAPAAIVLGLRADRYADCTGHPDLMALVDGGQIIIGPMAAGELRDAIERPAEIAGLRLEPGLVEVMLRDLDGRLAGGQYGGYDPGRLPLLSYALLATWQRRTGTLLDLVGYQDAGGIDGAITTAADRLHDDLSPEERSIMRRVLLRLVSVGEDPAEDARARVRRDELLALAADEERVRVETMLDRLVEARLVTANEDHLEITHDALLRAWDRLRFWIDEDRDALILRRHLTTAAKEWNRAGRDPSELYGASRLERVRERAVGSWRAELGPLVASFIDASEEQLARLLRGERRRRQGRRALLAVPALVLVAALLAALQLITLADAQRSLADSRQVVVEAAAQSAADPGLAAMLSVQAQRIAPTAETTSSLLGVRDPGYRELPASGTVNSVAVSPIGGRLAVADQGGGVELWDIAARTHTLLDAAPDRSPTYAVAFSPDGVTVAGASQAGVVTLWDAASGRRVGVLAGHRGPVQSIAFSPDGRLAATGGIDGTIRLWSTTSRTEVAALVGAAGPTGPINSVAFSPNGRVVASANADTTVAVWNVASRSREVVLHGPALPVTEVAFDAIGGTLAIVGDDGSVRLWDGGAQTFVGTIPETAIGHIRSVAFAPGGGTLAVGSDHGAVQIWRLSQRVLVPAVTLRGSLASVQALAFGPDGTLAAAEGNSRIGIWDLGGSSLLGGQPAAGQAPAAALALAPAASDLLATAGADGIARVWRARDGAAFWTVPAPTGAGASSRRLAMARTPDGRTLLAAPAGFGLVAVWDVGARRRLALLGDPGASQPVSTLALSPDGRQVAFATSGPLIQLWDVPTQGHAGDIADAYASVNGVAFSPDGRVLASANDDGIVDVSDVRSRALIAQLPAHVGPVETVAFSPDGATVATGGDEGTVTLWSVASHQQLGLPLTGHRGAVVSVAFGPDGHRLAGAGQDGTALLWNLPDRGLVATLGGQIDATAVGFSTDGSTLLGSGAGGELLSWDTNPDRVAAWICARHPALTPDQWRQYLPADQPNRSSCP
jgi:WD40 repeat protein